MDDRPTVVPTPKKQQKKRRQRDCQGDCPNLKPNAPCTPPGKDGPGYLSGETQRNVPARAQRRFSWRGNLQTLAFVKAEENDHRTSNEKRNLIILKIERKKELSPTRKEKTANSMVMGSDEPLRIGGQARNVKNWGGTGISVGALRSGCPTLEQRENFHQETL